MDLNKVNGKHVEFLGRLLLGFFTISLVITAGVLLFSCAPGQTDMEVIGPSDDVPYVVRGQAVIPIVVDGSTGQVASFVTRGQATAPVTVTVAPNVTFTVSFASLAAPANTAVDTMSLGSVSITALRDNTVALCGTGGTTQCTQAVIRAYTTGVSGVGLWNNSAGYGAPLFLTQGSTKTTVLLTTGSTIQSYAIPSTSNVVHSSNFTSLGFSVSSDTSNAGAGTYMTNLVIEYDLQ